MTTDIEKKYVHDVYSEIAIHWHNTRSRFCSNWPNIIKFFNELPRNSLVADIGCGNGRFLNIRNDIYTIGFDYCFELLKISNKSNSNNLIRCNALDLPIISNSFDATINIAVLHHFSTIENRTKVIDELIRITKINGKILLYVWAFEQEETSRISNKNIREQDEYIDFNLQEKYIENIESIKNIDELQFNKKEKLLIFKRYYHFYKKDEIQSLLNNFTNIKIMENGYDRGNWYYILTKNK